MQPTKFYRSIIRDINARLFSDFAYQRLLSGFIRIYLAAYKLITITLMLRCISKTEQIPMLIINDRHRNIDDF